MPMGIQKEVIYLKVYSSCQDIAYARGGGGEGCNRLSDHEKPHSSREAQVVVFDTVHE